MSTSLTPQEREAYPLITDPPELLKRSGNDRRALFANSSAQLQLERVIDHYRKHKLTLIPSKADGDADKSHVWLENLAPDTAPLPKERVVKEEDEGRQRQVLAQILKQHVGELWSAGEFQKLMVLEYLFVLGGRNKDAAARFGIADEKAVAGIKFRAVERLRGMARQRDPNHSLFLGLWQPGAR